jgi:quinoprotein glucose dehydrogenase
VLAKLISDGTTADRKAAFEALGTLKHPKADELLAAQLKLLDTGKVAPAVQLELLEAAAKRQDPALKKLLAEHDAAIAKSSDELAPYRATLEGGSSERGKKLFLDHPVLACIRCHKLGSDGGGDAGPNLGASGAEYSREYLLHSIVKPSVKIAPGFETATVTLESGAVRAGTVAAEDENMIRLKLPDNTVEIIAKADIAKRETAPSSMTEIYGQILSKSELRDMVEFLTTLTSKTETTSPEADLRALKSVSAK